MVQPFGVFQGSFMGLPRWTPTTCGPAAASHRWPSLSDLGGCCLPLAPGLIENLERAGSRPLPLPIQSRAQRVFGSSFSDVRIHLAPEVGALGAAALTCHSRIFVSPQFYDPHSEGGRKLLGQELAHVVQQRAGLVHHPFGAGLALVRDPRLDAAAGVVGTVIQQAEEGTWWGYVYDVVSFVSTVSSIIAAIAKAASAVGWGWAAPLVLSVAGNFINSIIALEKKEELKLKEGRPAKYIPLIVQFVSTLAVGLLAIAATADQTPELATWATVITSIVFIVLEAFRCQFVDRKTIYGAVKDALKRCWARRGENQSLLPDRA
jgi:hypothetical protein